jgi:F-type H+-transporting ATPase subunit delta
MLLTASKPSRLQRVRAEIVTVTHPGTVAGVYAASLLAVASDRGSTAAVIEACRILAKSLSVELIAELDSPRLGKAKAKAVLAAALTDAPVEISDLLQLLVDRDRLADAPAILNEAVDRQEAAAGVRHVQVRTATPLTGIALERFQTRIRNQYGEQAVIDQTVDPALKGGLTVRVGDFYLDASVRRRLIEMKQRILSTPLRDDVLWAS